MPKVVQKAPIEIPYPIIEKSSEKKPPKAQTGSAFYSDIHITAQLASTVALWNLSPLSTLAGLLLGASKPIYDYLKFTSIGKGTFSSIQKDSADPFVSKAMNIEQASKGKVKDKDVKLEKKLKFYMLQEPTYKKRELFLASKLIPIFFTYAFKGLPLISNTATVLLSSQIGFEWALKSMQFLIPPPPKKKK